MAEMVQFEILVRESNEAAGLPISPVNPLTCASYLVGALDTMKTELETELPFVLTVTCV